MIMWIDVIRKIDEKILDLLFPRRCPICDDIVDRGIQICPECRKRITWISEPACKKCGKPLEEEREEYCFDCNRKKHYFIQGKALWLYRGEVKNSLYRFKYQNRREYAVVYGAEAAAKYGAFIKRMGIQAIVPVPLHKKRQRLRGYNQAQLVAEVLGEYLQIPVIPDLINRKINTKPQKNLSDTQRKNNLQKAFKIEKSIVQLDYILIVDDIYTTGSTIDGVAYELYRQGARHIYFFCVSIGEGY